jgi:hypothetical protein
MKSNLLTNSSIPTWSNNIPVFKFCCFCGRRWQTFFIIKDDNYKEYYVNQEQCLPFTDDKCPLCTGRLVDYEPPVDMELIVK